MAHVRRDREYRAPWSEKRAYRVRTESGVSRQGYVLVRWLEGPLKGREARLEAKTLMETI